MKSMKKDYSLVLNRPRITEKSGIKAESQSVYTFEINPEVTKTDVAHAIKEYYKVTPVKVNITKLPSKTIFSRGKSGMRSGVKKAVVYLKKGEKIEFI
jgi:large subunit ribosomal protein L23